MSSVVWFESYWHGVKPEVGGKGASLGEMTGAGLPVPPGFALTTSAFRVSKEAANLDSELACLLTDLDTNDTCHGRRPVSQDPRSDHEDACRSEGRDGVARSPTRSCVGSPQLTTSPWPCVHLQRVKTHPMPLLPVSTIRTCGSGARMPSWMPSGGAGRACSPTGQPATARRWDMCTSRWR